MEDFNAQKWVKNQLKKHDNESDKKQLDIIVHKRINMLSSIVQYAIDN